jgi:hypothetical protein
MIKIITFTCMLLTTSLALAQKCKVYGISDSPQRLHCSFPKQQIELSCRQGTYYLNEDKVEAAYHYDVMRGPSPLVFKTDSLQMVVEIYSSGRMPAELQIGNAHLRGRCR